MPLAPLLQQGDRQLADAFMDWKDDSPAAFQAAARVMEERIWTDRQRELLRTVAKHPRHSRVFRIDQAEHSLPDPVQQSGAWSERHAINKPCDPEKIKIRDQFSLLIQDEITRRLKTKEVCRVLEIGAGSLDLLEQIREYFPKTQHLQLTAIDPAKASSETISRACTSNITYLQQSLRETANQKATEKFDLAFSFAGFEHTDIHDSFAASRDCLSSDGSLLMFFTASDSPIIAKAALDLHFIEIRIKARQLAIAFLKKIKEDPSCTIDGQTEYPRLLSEPFNLLGTLKDEFASELLAEPTLFEYFFKKSNKLYSSLNELSARIVNLGERCQQKADFTQAISALDKQVTSLQALHNHAYQLSAPLFKIQKEALCSRFGAHAIINLASEHGFAWHDGGWSLAQGLRRYHFLHFQVRPNPLSAKDQKRPT